MSGYDVPGSTRGEMKGKSPFLCRDLKLFNTEIT